MSFGKRKDGRFYSKTNSSGTKTRGTTQSSGIKLKPQSVDKNELAIQFIHDKYSTIMGRTAALKGGGFHEGNVVKTNISKGGSTHHKRVEAYCGASTEAISKMLTRKFGKGFVTENYGFYSGDDKRNSEGYNELEDELRHEWISLPDGTIIDNACGQLVPNNLHIPLGKKERLRIIRPDDPRQKYYSNSYL